MSATRLKEQPTAVFADSRGRIAELKGLTAAGRSGRSVRPIDPQLLIPLPRGSTLYLLPGRYAVGMDNAGRPAVMANATAVSAFLPPGYTATALAAFERQTCAPTLPLYCYCAVCWYREAFHVPALRVDDDPKHDPASFDISEVRSRVRRMLRKNPGNRLLAHHGLVCALRYRCPNAANLFLGRWEAPVAVSGSCNAACRGCISNQVSAEEPSGRRGSRPTRPRSGSVCSPQVRIGFTPTIREILDIAVPHLERAPRAMISFGQGCEGEPLLRWKLIEDAIRAIRRETDRGTIHINTNGSRPGVVERLADAGLDSIRISLNSARRRLYEAYYRCRSYSFGDVKKSFRSARNAGLWVSANYLTFPGVTDDKDEYSEFSELLAKANPDMIQWRNLNIDPDRYMDTVEGAFSSHKPKCMGITVLMQRIRRDFTGIRMGYFNPPV